MFEFPYRDFFYYRMSFSGEFGPQIGNRLYTLLVAGEPEHPEETYKDTGRTCKLHRERPHHAPGIEPNTFCFKARAQTAAEDEERDGGRTILSPCVGPEKWRLQ